jgi:hypothetical protein
MVPAVKTRLLERMRDRPELADVAVTRAINPERPADAVWFGDARIAHEPRAIKAGRRSRDEEAELEFYVYTYLAGSEAEDAELRAFGHLSAIEDIVADDPHIGFDGGDVSWVIFAGVRSLDSGPREEGADCLLVAAIRLRARLD